MSDIEDRVPVHGFTRSKEYSVDVFYRIYPPNMANEHDYWLATDDQLGIEPRPTRTGPGGISEADARRIADYDDTQITGAPTYRAARAACIPVVEQWDAEDAAAANAPVVVMVKLDREDAEAVLDCVGSYPKADTEYRRFINASLTAIAEALA